jgi:uncharacterized membrane protein
MPRKVSYVTFALIASVFYVLYNVFDNANLHGPLKNFYSYSIVGGIIGIIVTFVLGRIIGKKIEPDFTGFKILPKKAMMFALGAGIIGSVMTAFYLLSSSLYDPSIITPLTQTALIYLLLVDSLFIEKTSPNLTEIESIIIIIIGSFLVTFNTAQVNLLAIPLMLVFYNLFLVCYVILKQKGMRVIGVDAVNFRLWMMIFLSVFLIIISSSITILNGTFSNVIGLIITNFTNYLPWVILSMAFVFFFFVFDLKALKIGKASLVQSLESLSIILAIPITLIASYFLPNVFGIIEWNAYSWLVKISGAVLILAGIIVVSLSESVRYYLIIKPALGYEEFVLSKLKRMREVESAELALNCNIFVKVNVKTIGRMSNTISTKIKKIEHVKKIISMPILKEA